MGLFRGKKKRQEVVLYTYPKLVFTWLLILAGFAFWFVAGWQIIQPEALGWIYGIILILTLITVSIDVDRNAAAFWAVVIVACWVIVLYLRDVKALTIFALIYTFFADLDVTYSRGFGILVSIVLTIPYCIMLFWTRLNNKWRITHNEFEHFSFGRSDDSLARGAKRVRSSYPDLLEFLFCLAGELDIYDSAGRRKLRTIPNVPLLPLVRRRISKLLETTQVTTAEQDIAADEEGAEDADAESET